MERRHFPDLTRAQIRDRILAEVALALQAGRLSDERPVWAILWSDEPVGTQPAPQRCHSGKKFVWNPDSTLGWIVAREAETDTVVTSLHRVNSLEVAA